MYFQCAAPGLENWGDKPRNKGPKTRRTIHEHTKHRISSYRMRAWLRNRGPFLQQFCPYKSAILDLSILFKTNYLVSFGNYPVCQLSSLAFSKFFCEEDKFFSISIKTGFAFPTKSLGASSVALINPPFCGDTFFYWHEIGAGILYLVIIWYEPLPL